MRHRRRGSAARSSCRVDGSVAARGIRVSTSAADAPSVLRQLTSRPSDRPGQDDWLMTTVVDHYGTFLPPQLVDGGSLTPTQLAMALDGLRSAVRDKGWLATDASLSPNRDDGRLGADERLWTWLAVSRGARGVTFGDWRGVRQSRRREPGRTRRDNQRSRPRRAAASRESSAGTRRSLRRSSLAPHASRSSTIRVRRWTRRRRWRCRCRLSIARCSNETSRSTSSISTRLPPAW